MKQLLILLVLAGIGWMVYTKLSGPSGPPKPSVHLGASVEEVEKVWGQPLNVLPQFDAQLRVYKAPSGKRYTLIFKNDELIEIHE